MATVFVPGVAHTTLSGMIGVNPWAVTHHWKAGSSITPWTTADITLLATTVFTAWVTQMKAQTDSVTSVNSVNAIDLTNSAGVGVLYTPAASTGTRTGAILPSSACMVMQNRIAARYRGGHPRTFWRVGVEPDLANEYAWTPAYLTSVATSVANWVGLVRAPAYSFGTGVLNHVIPRYTYAYTDDAAHHKYKKTRTGLLSVDTVQSYFGVPTIGSQRRRLHP